MDVRVLAALLAYGIGSISPGLLLARKRGVDLRGSGSGSTGATNVGRVLGKKAGRGVLVLDIVKGAMVTLAASFCEHIAQAPMVNICAFAVVFGHCFPLWHRFRGGKGVATTLGAILVAQPWAGIAALLGYTIARTQTRFASVRSLVAVTAMLTVAIVLRQNRLLLAASLWLLIVFTHRENIVRLWHKRELTGDVE